MSCAAIDFFFNFLTVSNLKVVDTQVIKDSDIKGSLEHLVRAGADDLDNQDPKDCEAQVSLVLNIMAVLGIESLKFPSSSFVEIPVGLARSLCELYGTLHSLCVSAVAINKEILAAKLTKFNTLSDSHTALVVKTQNLHAEAVAMLSGSFIRNIATEHPAYDMIFDLACCRAWLQNVELWLGKILDFMLMFWVGHIQSKTVDVNQSCPHWSEIFVTVKAGEKDKVELNQKLANEIVLENPQRDSIAKLSKELWELVAITSKHCVVMKIEPQLKDHRLSNIQIEAANKAIRYAKTTVLITAIVQATNLSNNEDKKKGVLKAIDDGTKSKTQIPEVVSEFISTL